MTKVIGDQFHGQSITGITAPAAYQGFKEQSGLPSHFGGVGTAEDGSAEQAFVLSKKLFRWTTAPNSVKSAHSPCAIRRPANGHWRLGVPRSEEFSSACVRREGTRPSGLHPRLAKPLTGQWNTAKYTSIILDSCVLAKRIWVKGFTAGTALLPVPPPHHVRLEPNSPPTLPEVSCRAGRRLRGIDTLGGLRYS